MVLNPGTTLESLGSFKKKKKKTPSYTKSFLSGTWTVVFFTSSLGVSEVQPVWKTTDADNQPADNELLGIILTYLACKNTKRRGQNNYFL